MNAIVRGALVFVALLALYLFLAGQADAVEIVAGLLCASVGAALSLGLSLVTQEPIVVRPPPRALLRPLAALLSEPFVVGRELVAVILRGSDRHRGGFVRQPFAFGGSEPREAGRRAATLIGLSLAPRTFVVRGERAEGTVLLHGLPPKAVSPDESWPT